MAILLNFCFFSSPIAGSQTLKFVFCFGLYLCDGNEHPEDPQF
ncbi:hypothetical protein [Laspinema olomoucense]|nr:MULTISPECIES: hypothetical protein [unclassified Laspinema]